MKATLIKGGGGDTYYELGLLSGLLAQGLIIDFIGSERDDLKHTNILRHKNVTFFALRGDQNPRAPITQKIFRILQYYARLLVYALKTSSNIFHIQWTEKFVYFDRTLLNVYYKLLGKKLVFTAHNINAGERDGHDSLLNRLTLKFMYKTVDHIIVHTERMKGQLVHDFGVRQEKVTVIEHGINSMIPISGLTPREARIKLHLDADAKVVLFFGNITPYKGLEFMISALSEIKEKYGEIKLVIVGRISNGEHAAYWKTIKNLIMDNMLGEHVICRTEFIPDEEVEIYFKAADVLVLPYKQIFQSGVLYLSYAFGLPVIASDVGALKEYIVSGKTGLICQPADAKDLARKIDDYFKSGLFKDLETKRGEIIEYVNNKYSWVNIGAKTKSIYVQLDRGAQR